MPCKYNRLLEYFPSSLFLHPLLCEVGKWCKGACVFVSDCLTSFISICAMQHRYFHCLLHQPCTAEMCVTGHANSPFSQPPVVAMLACLFETSAVLNALVLKPDFAMQLVSPFQTNGGSPDHVLGTSPGVSPGVSPGEPSHPNAYMSILDMLSKVSHRRS